jgi:hypothetical protein
VACCRRIWSLFTEVRSTTAVEIAERFADGAVSHPALVFACAAADAANAEAPSRLNYGQLDAAAHAAETDLSCSAADAASRAADAAAMTTREDRVNTRERECRQQAILLRELIGPIVARGSHLDSAWLSRSKGTAVKLARAVYDEPSLPDGTLDPTRLSELADALEQVGCADKEMLAHLRQQDGVHVRGCWVLDLLLEKQ